ncbi:mannosyltransferase putative-domain-containing protein [Obelidium mucronatum]|nr:mannosyltransferase putative-domain-containing protein [Obelidium mucronatum]
MRLPQKPFEFIRLSNFKRIVVLGSLGLFLFSITGIYSLQNHHEVIIEESDSSDPFVRPSHINASNLDVIQTTFYEKITFDARKDKYLEERLQGVDVAQVLVMDYLQSKIQFRPNQTMKAPKYLASNFSLVHSYATSLKDKKYDRSDFRELARRGRAAYISFLLTRNIKETHSLSPGVSLKSIQHQFNQILKLQTTSLFPFTAFKFKSITEMFESFAYQDPSSFGIVITTGTERFYLTYHAILSLREVLGVRAPIEVHYGGHSDLHPKLVEAFNKLPNVKTVNLLEIFPHEVSKFSWVSLKPFAILAASFRTVIYMDNDVLFFSNPVQVLQSDLFKKTGQLYYHDRTILNPEWAKGPVWLASIITSPSPSSESLRYMTGRSHHEMDSSFMVVDKGRPGIFLSLLLTCRMNSKIEREKTTYVKTYGDKESFWIANELLRVPFSFSTGLAGSLGYFNEQETQKVEGRMVVCGFWLLHLNETGHPFFWNGGGVLKDRKATPKTGFEFIEIEGLTMSVEGKGDGESGEYFGDFCFRQKDELVSSFNDEEMARLERYKSMFLTDFFAKGLLGVGQKWFKF